MSLNLSFTGVQDGFPKVAEGEHRFIIDDAIVKPAASGTSDNLVITTTVADSDQPDEIGKSHRENINIQASTMWRVQQFFRAVTNDPELQSVDLEPEDLVGMEFMASIEHGEKYANITAFAPVG